jgi:hypothetical protein
MYNYKVRHFAFCFVPERNIRPENQNLNLLRTWELAYTNFYELTAVALNLNQWID